MYTDGHWTGNLRWARTLSDPVCAIRVTKSTALIARAFINRRSREAGVVDRWKTFLALVSDASNA